MHQAPEGFLGEAKVVYQNGKSVPIQPAIERRREQLALPKIPEPDYQELKDIMDMAGLNDLVMNSSEGGENKEGI